MEQQRQIYINSTGPIVVSMIVAGYLCWYMRNSAGTLILSFWLSIFYLVAFGRLWLVIRAHQPEKAHLDVKRLDSFFLYGTWCTAIIWGAASFILFPDTSHEHQTVFAIIIAGISGGAIISLCSNWLAIAGFLSFTLLPLAAKFLIMQLENGVILSVLIVLYYVICLVGARKLYRNITDNISLRLDSTENEKSLKIGQDRYQHIFNNSPLGIVHYDLVGSIIDCNDIFAQVIGIPKSELVGKDMLSILKNMQFKAALKDSLQKGEGYFKGEFISEATGQITPACIYLKATKSADDEIYGGIGMLENFTERKFYEQKIEHQASFDSLTGLPNRRQLLKQLEQELSRAMRYEQNGALLLMDLDNFKTINDSLGHRAGDAILQQVAARLNSNLRKEDITARMGGDEFVILLPQLGHNIDLAGQNAQDIAKKLTHALITPFIFENQELNITPSIGISLFPEQEKGAGDILKQADTAMNQAKKSGRNTVRFFLPSMQQAADKRLRLSNDLKKAILNDEFSMFFQPQVKIDGTVVGAEGLLRWAHPKRGMILPGEFISAAEETGIIVDIGNWVFRQICRTVKDWEDEGLLSAHQTIAVNISPREFSTADFVDRIINTLNETGVNPQHLDIELTEGSLISSVSDTIKKIQSLREYGIKFSVDDFGTGYSSLSYLKSLPLHKLKIDRSFVKDISHAGEEVTLVEIIITMARNLGLQVVAEGVESAEQLNYLASKGCNVYQGYYFCKPIPSAEFRKLLQSGRVQN